MNASEGVLELCDLINPAYFVSRYLDVGIGEYSKDEVSDILKASREVLKWVEKEIRS